MSSFYPRYSVLYLICCVCTVSALFEREQATVASYKGDWKQVAQNLDTLVINNPDDAQLLYDAGVAAFNTGEFDVAQAYFQKVNALPQVSEHLQERAAFNAGNTYVEQKKLGDAISSYQRVLALNPDNEHAKHNLDVVLKMQQQQQENDKKENKDQQNNKQDKQDKQQSDKQDDNQNKNQDQQKHNSDDKQQQGSDQQQSPEESGNKENKQDSAQNDQKNNKQDGSQEQENKPEQQGDQQQERNASEQEKQAGADDKEKEESGQQGVAEKSDQQDSGQEEKGAEQKSVQEQKPYEKDPRLAHILKAVESNDTAINKQMIRAAVKQSGAGSSTKNSW